MVGTYNHATCRLKKASVNACMTCGDIRWVLTPDRARNLEKGGKHDSDLYDVYQCFLRPGNHVNGSDCWMFDCPEDLMVSYSYPYPSHFRWRRTIATTVTTIQAAFGVTHILQRAGNTCYN